MSNDNHRISFRLILLMTVDVFITPDTSKRCKTSYTEDDQTPQSRMVPTGEQTDSSNPFIDSYEQQFPPNFYDPNISNSPYLRFTPNYPFPYTPAASTPSSSPLAFAAAMAASRYSSPYSFSSHYYSYPSSS